MEEYINVLSGLLFWEFSVVRSWFLFWRESVLLRVAGCELRGKEGKVKNYKDLEIYKLSYDLAIKIHPVRNKRQELCFILT